MVKTVIDSNFQCSTFKYLKRMSRKHVVGTCSGSAVNMYACMQCLCLCLCTWTRVLWLDSASWISPMTPSCTHWACASFTRVFTDFHGARYRLTNLTVKILDVFRQYVLLRAVWCWKYVAYLLCCTWCFCRFDSSSVNGSWWGTRRSRLDWNRFMHLSSNNTVSRILTNGVKMSEMARN